MRSAHDNGLLKEGEKLIGINLGADFVSEHEWGIKGIRQLFGMKETGHGLAKRTATKTPVARDWKTMQMVNGARLIETKKETILVVGEGQIPEDIKDVHRCFNLGRYDDKLVTAWDDKSFGINAEKKEECEAVRALHAAILNNDVAIWVGGAGVFQNGGLIVCIASAIPAEKAQILADADVDRENLKKAADATGIEERLKKVGKKWFALSPSWLSKDMETVNGPRKSVHPVMFWLNPFAQDKHNYGWFTVEELDQWATDQGPCMQTRGGK
jgi:hypothetical protein